MGDYYGKLFISGNCPGCLKGKKLLADAGVIEKKEHARGYTVTDKYKDSVEILNIEDDFGSKQANQFSINSVPAFALYKMTYGRVADIDTSKNLQNAGDVAEIVKQLIINS